MESKDAKGKFNVTSVISGGRRKLHYTFEDKREMIEEFDTKSHELLIRKWKQQRDYKDTDWIFEVGEPPQKEDQLIKPSSSNPIFVRKDTPKEYQFRIRNLLYPADVYSVETDVDKQELVVKTSNKKYFKRIAIPDLQRLNAKIEAGKVSWVYTNNTLVISYPKPTNILQQEQLMIKEFEKLNLKKPKEGDVECMQQ